MPDPTSRDGYILALDYGLRRIGVAVGQFTTMTATGLEIVTNGKVPDWTALDRLIEEWKPSRLLLGLPLNADGQETKMSAACRKFGNQLEQRYRLPLSYQDERLSSRTAQSQFADLRAQGSVRRKDVRRLDAVAARIFLENWLQSQPPAENSIQDT